MIESWKLAAFITAVLYGFHNVCTKLAAGKISDQLGGLVLEGTAAILILAYIVFLRFQGDDPIHFTKEGLLFSMLAGASVAVGSILYFRIFRSGGDLSIAGPLVLVGGSLLMVTVGIVGMGEKISWQNGLGLALGMASIYLLSTGKG